MKSSLARKLGAIALAFAPALAPAPVKALAVFDGANFAQNLLTAVRTLEVINNQIRSLQNEAIMIESMAKHLAPLNFSSLGAIETTLRQINVLMARAQGIAFEISATDSEFARLFPREYAVTATSDALALDARERWRHSMDAFHRTMAVQAQVVQSVAADTDVLLRLVNESQEAIGSLQAQQATNQLIALSAKQQLQTQELMAAQYRSQSLEHARDAQAQEQARAQFLRFLGDGRAYTPRD